jgi:hypothetical protein
MSLNEILELCEKHMSEGDYLKASNTLKNIHHNKPEILTNGDIQYLVDIKITDVENIENIIYIRKIITDRNREIKKIEFMTENDELDYHWINYEEFIDFLSIWNKVYFIDDIKINSVINCNIYYNHFYKMFKNRFDDENDYDINIDYFGIENCAKEFSNYFVERLKEIIKFNIIHQ